MDEAKRQAWLDRHLTKLEREQFETAKKIPAAEWKGVALCVPPGDDNGYFFTDVAEIANRFDGEGGHFPVFAWDCDVEPFELTQWDTDAMIENALVDHHEDAADKITDAQREELATFVAGWAKRTGIVSWHPSMTRAVMLTPPADDALSPEALVMLRAGVESAKAEPVVDLGRFAGDDLGGDS